MVFLAAFTSTTGAQTPDSTLWTTNGYVNAFVPIGNVMFVGGDFNQVGLFSGCGVPLDASTGLPVPGFPRIRGIQTDVFAALDDGAGGWFVGGIFGSVGGQDHDGLAHILADGSVASWAPKFKHSGSSLAEIDAMALSDSTLYIAGYFDSVGGQARQYLAAVNTRTAEPTSWNPQADAEVKTIQVHGGLVYVGGAFTTIGDSNRSGIAALDPVMGAATDWNPDLVGTNGGGSEILSMWVDDAAAYVGGTFPVVGGKARNNIAALDLVTGVATNWNPNVNGSVTALASDGSVLYVGGVFSQIGGIARSNLAAADLATGSVTSWQADADHAVAAIAVHQGIVYIGGVFTTVAGQTRRELAALDATTAALQSWDPRASASVFAVAANDNQVYAGGAFTIVGGKTRNQLAAFDVVSGAATDWNPSALGGQVQTMVALGDSLYVGGSFTSVGGLPRNGLACVDIASGQASSWDPNPAGGTARQNVLAMVTDGSLVYVGGVFTSVGGVSRRNVAALDPVSGAPTGWDPKISGSPSQVAALLVSPGIVYVGGTYDSVGNHAKRSLAAVYKSTGGDTGWNPQMQYNGWVNALSQGLHGVLVAGGFNFIGGQARPFLGEVDATGHATPWNPNPDGAVYATLLHDGIVYACGSFGQIGAQKPAQDFNYVGAVDATSGNALDWIPQAAPLGSLRAIAVAGNMVYVGGAPWRYDSAEGAATAALASVVSATADSSSIDVTWFVSGTTVSSVLVERREGRGAWAVIASLSPDDRGMYVLHDSSIVPGATYGYRLAIPDGASEIYAGLVEVSVSGKGSASTLALLGAYPNPAPSEPSIEFRLPDSSPATLSLMDVRGRSLAVREVGQLGPGIHSLQLVPTVRPAAGVYFVRLRHGEDRIDRRIVLLGKL
jgi:hypothetical protein